MQPIRVLVVDDTATYRKILSDVVESISEAELAGTAPGGRIALKKLEQTVTDVVLLDIFMPEMDGIATLSRIRAKFPDVSVVMISGATTRDADITVKALQMGALDFVPKPRSNDYAAGIAELSAALRPILRAVEIKRLMRLGGNAGGAVRGPVCAASKPDAPPTTPDAAAHFAPTPSRFDLVVIAVSTGGIKALHSVISPLPADLPAPVLIVQHMPEMFTASLADNLAKHSSLGVREARDNELVAGGSALIAPGGRHMTVRQTLGLRGVLRIGINDSPPVNSCRPSADVLFRSVAATDVGGVLAVILTGMGCDGAAGVAALKRKGCYCISQDEQSCVVYGMPRAVVERGLSDETLPLDAIAARIAALATGRLAPRRR